MFAQAIMSKPPLLVMDEPTNGLDPYWMESFVQLVRSLKNEGHAVLFQLINFILLTIADRILFIHEGHIAQERTNDDYKVKYGPLGIHVVFTDLIKTNRSRTN